MATIPPDSTPPPRRSLEIPLGTGAVNPELVVFLLVWIVIALIWLFDDEVGAATFATLTVALTFGYLVSRGIAKASRVYE